MQGKMLLHLKAEEVLLLASRSWKFTQEISQPNFKHETNLTPFRAVQCHCNFTPHNYPNLHHSTQGKNDNSMITGCVHLVLSKPCPGSSSQAASGDVLPGTHHI